MFTFQLIAGEAEGTYGYLLLRDGTPVIEQKFKAGPGFVPMTSVEEANECAQAHIDELTAEAQ